MTRFWPICVSLVGCNTFSEVEPKTFEEVGIPDAGDATSNDAQTSTWGDTCSDGVGTPTDYSSVPIALEFL